MAYREDFQLSIVTDPLICLRNWLCAYCLSAHRSCSLRGNRETILKPVFGAIPCTHSSSCSYSSSCGKQIGHFPHCAAKLMLFCRGYADSSGNLLSRLITYFISLMWHCFSHKAEETDANSPTHLSTTLISSVQALKQDFITQSCVSSCFYTNPKCVNWCYLILVPPETSHLWHHPPESGFGFLFVSRAVSPTIQQFGKTQNIDHKNKEIYHFCHLCVCLSNIFHSTACC